MSNAIETIDNETICFIIFCLNCIRMNRALWPSIRDARKSSKVEKRLQRIGVSIDVGVVTLGQMDKLISAALIKHN